MEPGAAAAPAPAAARAQGALWRVGADGRELSRLAGGSRPAGMSDGFGGRRDEHDAGAVGGGRNDLGGGGGIARLDRALRGAAGALRGLEELIQGEAPGTTVRRRTGDAVRAYVRATGGRDYRRQLTASQGARGASPRHASGPAGEEAAARRDCDTGGGQCVPGGGLPGRAQPALCTPAAEVGGLSSGCTGQGGAGSDLPPAERAPGKRGLGGALREPIFPTGAAAATLRTGSG